jgi:hypothetical protein
MYALTQYQRELAQSHYDDLLRDARAAQPGPRPPRRPVVPQLLALVRRRQAPAARVSLRPSV